MPTQNGFCVQLVDVLTAGPGRARVGEFKFGARNRDVLIDAKHFFAGQWSGVD
jgi:hypothetical protein